LNVHSNLNDVSSIVDQGILQVINAALESADPYRAIVRKIRLNNGQLFINDNPIILDEVRNVYLVAFGKASIIMSKALCDILGNRVKQGVVITKQLISDCKLPSMVKIIKGSHPIPDESSVLAAGAIIELLRNCEERDLVFCLISGGGSALITLPNEGTCLEDIRSLTNLLLASGAEIGEINTLRKHLDRIKGGGLLKYCYPARIISLILSDVIGDPLDVIASGPTVPDLSTFHDALMILEKYDLLKEVSPTILQVIKAGVDGIIPETLKPGDPACQSVVNLLVANNCLAAEKAIEQARQLGFTSLLLTTRLHGESRQVGRILAEILRQITVGAEPIDRPVCLIAGGETTVTVTGKGYGGRNLEVALGAVEGLAGLEKVSMVTLATDGEDGPTDAAGAVVNGDTLSYARKFHLRPSVYLLENNSYAFFDAIKSLIKIGPTGTNVNDLIFLFALK
jgi:glycerate 2-kinase